MPKALRFTLTKSLIASIEFDQQWVGMDRSGNPVVAPTPETTSDWLIYDSEVPGLYIRVTANERSWGIRKRRGGDGALGNPVRRSLGKVEHLSLNVARERARAWMADLGAGLDPKAIQKDAAAARRQTVGDHFDQWRLQMDPTSKPATVADRRLIGGWMKASPLWKKSIWDVSTDDVEATFGPMFALAMHLERGEPVSSFVYRSPAGSGSGPKELRGLDWGVHAARVANKHPKRVNGGSHKDRSGLASVWKCFRYTKAAWVWAIASNAKVDTVLANPFKHWAKGKKLPKPKGREQRLDAREDDGKRWLQVIWEQRSHSSNTIQATADLLWLTALWGTRLKEVAISKWKDVDTKLKVLNVPANRVKNGRPFAVPLTDHALGILEERRQRNAAAKKPAGDDDWIFPSRWPDRPIRFPYTMLRNLEAKGEIPKLRPHDLRRGAASDVARMSGERQGMITALLLNHASGDGMGQVTMEYVVDKADQLRPYVQHREQILLHLLGMAPEPPLLAAFNRSSIHAPIAATCTAAPMPTDSILSSLGSLSVDELADIISAAKQAIRTAKD